MSVVSHGHLALVQRLLEQLAAPGETRVAHVVLTHNIAEGEVAAPAGGWPFRLTGLRNARPAGFGANHNRAFAQCATPLFCVLNPDIELPAGQRDPWTALAQAAAAPRAGCAYPRLVNGDGTPQDSEREAVTPAALLRRHVLKRRGHRTDWVSAAFWVVPAPVWRELGGFDERYFMYCEDTDFCLRLQLAGHRLVRADAQAIHHAQRGSRSDWRHLGWHLQSLFRLWRSPVLRRWLRNAA